MAEKLDGIAALHSVLRLGDVRDDLQRLFTGLNGQTTRFELIRERKKLTGAETAVEGKETSLHLVRLWAAGEIARLCRERKIAEATRLAGVYQLVTPVSGAVVLETKAQYERAGLQPVPAESVPTVPEPTTWALLLAGLALLRVWSKRKLRP